MTIQTHHDTTLPLHVRAAGLLSIYGEGYQYTTVSSMRELARRYAARGEIGRLTDEMRRIIDLRQLRAKRATPPPSVRDRLRQRREQRYSALIREHGPIPECSGAGDIYEGVSLGGNYDCQSHNTFGDRSSVANSYGYAVIDHHVTWTIPRTSRLVLIEGVVTAGIRLVDLRRSRREAVPCAWPEKSRGYSGRWVHGYLYRGVHVRAVSARAAQRKIERIRSERVAEALAARERRQSLRLEAREMRNVWVSEQDLLAIGACQAGIDSARRIAERELRAEGRLGAVRADWAYQHPEWASYVRRVVSHHQAVVA